MRMFNCPPIVNSVLWGVGVGWGGGRCVLFFLLVCLFVCLFCFVLFSRKFSVKIIIVFVWSSVYESYNFWALKNCEYFVKSFSVQR